MTDPLTEKEFRVLVLKFMAWMLDNSHPKEVFAEQVYDAIQREEGEGKGE